MCLTIWRGPAHGELDVLAILTILSTSCIITVPLINWSATLRNIGKDDIDREQTGKFHASARILTILCGFLVAIWLLSIFASIFNKNSKWSVDNLAGVSTMTCSPASQILDPSAGQIKGLKFLLTQEFIDANNCTNPCAIPYFPPVLFRDDTPLRPWTVRDINNWAGVFDQSDSDRRKFKFIGGYVDFGLWSLPYILCQGLWAVLVGRRSPAQARNHLYHFMTQTEIKILGKTIAIKGKKRLIFQAWVAKYLALAGYLWAVFTFVICVPLLVVNMAAAELLMKTLPEQEDLTSVGAWSPYASTVLVLIAAFIARFYVGGKDLAKKTGQNTAWWSLHSLKNLVRKLRGQETRPKLGERKGSQLPNPGLRKEATGKIWTTFVSKSWAFVAENFKDVIGKLKNEWIGFRVYCKDPTDERIKNNQGSRHGNISLTSSRNTSRHTSRQPSNRNSTIPPIGSRSGSQRLSTAERTALISRRQEVADQQMSQRPANSTYKFTIPSIKEEALTSSIPQDFLHEDVVDENQKRELQQLRELARKKSLKSSLRASRTERERRSKVYSPDLPHNTRHLVVPDGSPQPDVPLLSQTKDDVSPASSDDGQPEPQGLNISTPESDSPEMADTQGQSGQDWPLLSPRQGPRNRSTSAPKPKRSSTLPVTDPATNTTSKPDSKPLPLTPHSATPRIAPPRVAWPQEDIGDEIVLRKDSTGVYRLVPKVTKAPQSPRTEDGERMAELYSEVG